MCTAITLKTDDLYFGRNLDLDTSFGQQVVTVPRNYKLKFKVAEGLDEHYAFIGMAALIDGYPLFADGVNEMGLAMAGLNFPGFAHFCSEIMPGMHNIAPYELISWTLGSFSTVKEVKEAYERLSLIDIEFQPNVPVPPLHWIVSDEEQSIVLEATEEGVKVYDNPLGVLTNSPDFRYQITNVNNFIGMSAKQPENGYSQNPGFPLRTFGQGVGGFGLPGDFAPVSRFIKAGFVKSNSVSAKDEASTVTQFFHILDSVKVVKGSVKTDMGWERTLYSSCMNCNTGDYYFKTYKNVNIRKVSLVKEDLDGSEIHIYPVNDGFEVSCLN